MIVEEILPLDVSEPWQFLGRLMLGLLFGCLVLCAIAYGVRLLLDRHVMRRRATAAEEWFHAWRYEFPMPGYAVVRGHKHQNRVYVYSHLKSTVPWVPGEEFDSSLGYITAEATGMVATINEQGTPRELSEVYQTRDDAVRAVIDEYHELDLRRGRRAATLNRLLDLPDKYATTAAERA